MAKAALAHERLFALRSEIGRIESRNRAALSRSAKEDACGAPTTRETDLIASGVVDFDAALGGGLARAALHEIRTSSTSDNGAASGFALALAGLVLAGKSSQARLLWIADPMGAAESGRPYGPGLVAHGIAPSSFLHAGPKHLKDALMIAEAALTVHSFATIILEIYGNPAKFGLTETRRLNLRAKAYRRPVFLLRERGEEEASNAANRFLVRPAPASPFILPDGRPYPQGMGNPVFHVTIEKSRNPAPPQFFLEWNADDRHFHEIDPRHIAVSGDRRAANPVAPFSFPGDRQDCTDQMGQVLALPRAS